MPSQENLTETLDKENIKEKEPEVVKPEEKKAPTETKSPVKKKVVKKKVLSDKNDNTKESTPPQSSLEAKPGVKPKETKEVAAEGPSKPVERRKSRIFEAAEKFQNMISPTEPKPALIEKPKKILIPGVSVDGFKKEFERKSSIASTSPTKTVKPIKKEEPVPPKEPETEKTDDERKEQLRNAVNIISSALDKEGARKSKSRPCVIRKPPVPFGVGGRSASGNIGMLSSPLSPPPGPKPFVKANFDKSTVKQVEVMPEPVEETKTSTAEITLKSATLPRRKIPAKPETQLHYPVPSTSPAGFKTEAVHNIEAFPNKKRTEIIVPISGKPR